MINKRYLIKEQLYNLLEDITKYQPGDDVRTIEGDGTILLSKHPYYSVKLKSNGSTKPFHISKIKEQDFGKYNINESETEDIIESDFVVIMNTTNSHIGSILSDIRSIEGITIVRNDDVFNNNDYKNENYKTSLHIKIDPYPFKGLENSKVIQLISKEMMKIPEIKKANPKSNLPSKKIRSSIPVKSIDDLLEGKTKIKIIKKKLNEIKISSPIPSYISKGGPIEGEEGYINYVKDLSNYHSNLYKPVKKQYENLSQGLGQELYKIIIHNEKTLSDKYNLGNNMEWFAEWLESYIYDLDLPWDSSGAMWTSLVDFDNTSLNDSILEHFGIDYERAEDIVQKYYNQ